jgi:uncharacterized protein (DUF362 family)
MLLRSSRRQFLKALPLAAAAAACRRVPYSKTDFSLPVRSPMAILPAATYDSDLVDLVRRGMALLGVSVAGRRVFLKPNMVEYEANTAINTHPKFVAAVAIACRLDGAADVVVGEGPGHRRDMEYLLAGTGMEQAVADAGVRFVDLNLDDVRRVPLKSRYTGMEALFLSTELLRSDFVISLPKLKTHHFAGMTASMKNLFGVVPGAVYGWPKNILHFKGIEQSIIDLTATVRPRLTIVDAIVAMEGDGPIMGRPKPTGFLAMGTDLVAVDATCARMIGLSPEKMPYLSVASRFLGNMDSARIDQRGEDPRRFTGVFDVIQAIQRFRA